MSAVRWVVVKQKQHVPLPCYNWYNPQVVELEQITVLDAVNLGPDGAEAVAPRDVEKLCKQNRVVYLTSAVKAYQNHSTLRFGLFHHGWSGHEQNCAQSHEDRAVDQRLRQVLKKVPTEFFEGH